MPENNNAKKIGKLISPQTREKFLLFLKRHFVFTGITTSLISGLIFYVILLVPGKLYAEIKFNNEFDKNTVLRVQLLLSLNGYNLNSKEIDGKKGAVTTEAIRDYERKKGLSVTGDVSEKLYESLYKDTQPLLSQIEHETHTNDQSEEIKSLKAELIETNESLKNLTNNYTYHFITTYRDLTAVIGTSLGIVAGLLGGLIAWGVPKLENRIKEDIEQAHLVKMREAEERHLKIREETKSIMQYAIYSNLSSAFYKYYKLFLINPQEKNREIPPELIGGISLAIWFSEKAIENVKKLPNENKEKINWTDRATAHKAYHYASQQLTGRLKSDNKNRTLRDAEYLKNLAENFLKEGNIEKWMVYLDTVAWIFILLGDDENNKKEEGRALLKILSEYEDFLNECGNNYKKIGENIQTKT